MASRFVAAAPQSGVAIMGIPVEFILFGLTLAGVAVFHHHTLRVALVGLTVITLYKIAWTGFGPTPGLAGFLVHLEQEWVILANLLCLLMGFALLSRHFEKSHLPVALPRFLPHDWKGGFLMLVMVWVMSSFLDNIAAALIGGAMAHQLFRAKVHIGYLAAIVAASNAGGAWSVIGDTTTTMMWIAGVSPLSVAEAVIASSVALCLFGIPAAMQQQKYSPILKHAHEHVRIDLPRVVVIAMILLFAIATNLAANIIIPDKTGHFPFIGASVWVAIIFSVPMRRPDWEVLPGAFRGSVFLLSLVLSASMMPVDQLPLASWKTALGLGFLSSVFDNIPLTAMALKQGGYDWGFLAYTVGFGGSMIWFGSSAGVAISNMYPEAKSVTLWVRHGWHIAAAYVIAFFFMIGVWNWHPDPTPRRMRANTLPAAKWGKFSTCPLVKCASWKLAPL